jgi:hypothetical protein
MLEWFSTTQLSNAAHQDDAVRRTDPESQRRVLIKYFGFPFAGDDEARCRLADMVAKLPYNSLKICMRYFLDELLEKDEESEVKSRCDGSALENNQSINAYEVGRIDHPREHSNDDTLHVPIRLPFQRPRAMALARMLLRMSSEDVSVVRFPVLGIFSDVLIEHYAKPFFRDCIDEIRKQDSHQLRQCCSSQYQALYVEADGRIKSDKNYDNFKTAVDGLNSRVCEGPLQQSSQYLYIAYHEARNTRPLLEELLSGLGQKLRTCTIKCAELKSVFRALEKMALEADHSRRWTTQCVLDIVRGAISCPEVSLMVDAVEFLEACTVDVRREGTHKLKDVVQDLPRINIVRVKNRFSEPTRGGWVDLLLNITFEGNPHVVEVQIHHILLERVRDDWGGHKVYAKVRVLQELLVVANEDAPEQEQASST